MACGYACGVTVVLKLGLEVWYFGTTPSSKKPKKRKPDESAPIALFKMPFGAWGRDVRSTRRPRAAEFGFCTSAGAM